MTTIKTAMCTVVTVFCLCTAAGASVAKEAPGADAFARAARDGRDAWSLAQRGAGGTVDAILQARARLQAHDESATPGGAVLRYLAGRLSFLAGQKDVAEGQFSGALPAAIAPEDVAALFELHPSLPQRRLVRACYLAALLPVSGWRGDADGSLSVFYGDITPPRPFVPMGSRQGMSEVAECLERSGLYDAARGAYAAAVYSTFTRSRVAQPPPQSWLSLQAAAYWPEMARCARLAGRQEVAWDYLMKATVFGDEALFERSLETAKEWAAEPEPPTPAPVDLAVKREALTKAVRLYAEMNAHPRAFTLIDENRDAFEDPDALRKEVEEQWLAVVKDMSRLARKVTLYGYEVYPNGDPLKVRIPWALSDEALADVRARLVAMHEAEAAANDAAAAPEGAAPAPPTQ